jgi:hypothetical protein
MIARSFGTGSTGGEREREKIAADREQHVVLLERFAHPGSQTHHGALEQRMRGGKGRRVGDAFGVDRRAEELGELDELGMGAALRDRVACDQQRPLGLREQRRGCLDRLAVATQPRCDAGRRRKLDLGLGIEDVGRQRHEHRAGRRRERSLGGAMHDAREISEPMHLGRPFDQRARQRRKIRPQDRLGDVEALIVLAGGDEDRRARLLRVVEHAHAVAQSGRDMQVDGGELAGRLRIAVRHGDDGGLLEREHVAQLVLGRERVHQRQLRRSRIAEQDLDALLFQQLEEGALSGHDGHVRSPVC